jgi:Ni,Fe-hydrogenase III small subunit
MFDIIKILLHQGKQFIPDPGKVEVPGIFRGRPIISMEQVDTESLVSCCPAGAISDQPVSIDLGKCTFCGDCARRFPAKIQFTKDYKIATNQRDQLIISEGDDRKISINHSLISEKINLLYGRSLKLRQVSAGGDNSCEWELNAANNVQFDLSRYGIEFVASPRHADGIVITGPITRNMSEALQLTYDAIPDPKIIVLAGTDAINGGLFSDNEAVDRSFLNHHHIDLYLPGNPVHPLTIINGLYEFTRGEYL